MITPIQKADEKNAYLQEKILGWRVWQIFAVIAAVGILLVGFLRNQKYLFILTEGGPQVSRLGSRSKSFRLIVVVGRRSPSVPRARPPLNLGTGRLSANSSAEPGRGTRPRKGTGQMSLATSGTSSHQNQLANAKGDKKCQRGQVKYQPLLSRAESEHPSGPVPTFR